MKTKSLLLGLLVAVSLLAGCSKDDKNEPKFDAEYGHATITINLQGTYKYLVTVNVIVNDEVLDVITKDKPTVTVEFPINGETSLRTEAVCDEEFDLVGTCTHRMNMTWDMKVMLDDDVVFGMCDENAYTDHVDYQSTVSDTPTSISSVYKLVHTDIDREFIFTKDNITGPKK
ncbi:MAG: hypothetical protein MJ002_07175 [Paludibacteraceae bacterium]|nr:hypothetical protein [Paludibacteraceae bacterium]